MSQKISPSQTKDTGLAIILILLLIAYFQGTSHLILPAIIILILTMTWPTIFKPLAHVWFWLSNFLGNIVSRVILTLIFGIIVIPIGLIRRLSGSDQMRFKAWKNGQGSLFVKRDHVISAKDIEKPY